jgi:hypothetical protein
MWNVEAWDEVSKIRQIIDAGNSLAKERQLFLMLSMHRRFSTAVEDYRVV